MKINVTLPFDHIEHPQEFLQADAVTHVATLLERVGFNGACASDHPCPTGRWLDAGGHYAQDPFVILSLVAAATRRLRLFTGILVLPYRNPFITARAVSTLDVFSAGRVTLGVGAGYLKGEFHALGVDFERRNELMDEYLNAIKTAWTQDEFTFNGSGYAALGNGILPRPIQQPHPPIVIGGNSKQAMRRAAAVGDGWWPFLTPGPVSTTTRTAAIDGVDDLAAGIRYLREHCDALGREKLPEIMVAGFEVTAEKWNAQQWLDRIVALREIGVDAITLNVGGATRAAWCDNAERYAVEVIAKLGQ